MNQSSACSPSVHLRALALACGVAMWVGAEAQAQTILLDSFESGSIRVINPAETDPSYRLLWNQYEGDFTEGPDPGVESVSSATARDGTYSLKVTVTGGNLYLQFYPCDGVWRNMREFTQPSSAWQMNTFTRMRFWIKMPPGVSAAPPGQANLQIGTYVRASTGDSSSAEDGGNHFYHHFNIPYTGQWHQLIVDTHPNHIRGANGGVEHGDQLYPTGETGFNYFDALTRFYMDIGGSLPTYPADFYVDGIELYRELQPENVAQIYSLNGVYVPSTNTIRVGWMRDKDENSVNHEVRYSFSDVFQVGWANATPAPGGLVTPPGWQGYNGMEWSTSSIDVSGRSVVYIAIKPQNASGFRQIAIPLSSGSSPPDTTPPTVTSVAPANGATGISASMNVTATFSEAMTAATINPTTFELRDPANVLVPATVTYDAVTRTATLNPTASLAYSTTYTATVRGGATGPRVKDLAGNALASSFIWSFATAAPPPPPTCPCSIWSSSTTPAGIDRDTNAVEIGVKFRADSDGVITALRFYKYSVNTGTHVGHLWTRTGTLLATATFTGETASGWQQVTLASPVAVTANTTYVASYHTTVGRYAVNSQYFASSGVDNAPLHALATRVDGGNGVYGYGPSGTFPAKSRNSENYWVDVVFTTSLTATVSGGASDPPAKDLAGNATDRPRGPILVVSSPANPYSRYYAEILRAEGLNAFAVADLSTVSATTLTAYDVVILGEMPLTAAQVTMFTDWVNGGGNLISMRPDKQLAGLLGLTDQASTLANGYVLVDGSTAPGAGIVTQTIQFHGAADRYALAGATAIATLYTSASTATAHPAVTLISVGVAGGQAAAFTYDLARSVVYTRQGNPDNLFFGAKAHAVQPDWIDLDKVAIPQADEQQRLLANLILHVNRDRTPLPRFWYFPRSLKAVVVMTSNDDGVGGTAGRFDAYKAASPPGCSVANWECIRSTSYISPNSLMSDPQAAAYDAEGFELGVHINTGCTNRTPASLQTFYTDQLGSWRASYPSVPAQSTHGTQCLTWSAYATQPQVELTHGMRLDTNDTYYPSSWVLDRPGFFTGSGVPMRFVDASGALIDVYQAATQMTDDSGQTYPFTIDTLLDKAIGPEGYYGAFTANMHTDLAASADADAIVAAAQARGVPIIAARQLLEWLDGRNGSSFGALTWSGNALSFSIAVGAGGNGLQAMLPTTVSGGALTTLTVNGTAVPFTRQTIKGIEYAIFSVVAGTYQATYAH